MSTAVSRRDSPTSFITTRRVTRDGATLPPMKQRLCQALAGPVSWYPSWPAARRSRSLRGEDRQRWLLLQCSVPRGSPFVEQPRRVAADRMERRRPAERAGARAPHDLIEGQRALALDQVVRSPRARALGWTPSLHSVGGNAARLLDEWRASRN